MTAFNLGDFWQRLYVPPPPGEPACAGVAPSLFEVDPQSANNLVRAHNAGRALPLHLATQFDVALRYCASCPLAVREWCETKATRPQTSRVSIITGGKVFVQGRVVWDLRRQAAAERAA